MYDLRTLIFILKTFSTHWHCNDCADVAPEGREIRPIVYRIASRIMQCRGIGHIGSAFR